MFKQVKGNHEQELEETGELGFSMEGIIKEREIKGTKENC